MRRKRIGFKDFGGVIDITDPCYDKDSWCRINATVKDGNYECVVWRQSKKFVHDGQAYKDVRVGIIGIYLDGVIPHQSEFEVIGRIGVDAGLAGFFINKPDYNDDEWSAFCYSISEGDAWIKPEGFFSSSGYGDGYYGVYAHKENGEITALEIRFM